MFFALKLGIENPRAKTTFLQKKTVIAWPSKYVSGNFSKHVYKINVIL